MRDLTLTLDAGERLCLVGANGSGKSTLLAVLAGLRPPDGGALRRPDSPPGMLFQHGALWPHMTVERHLAFVDGGRDPAWRARLLDLFALGELRGARPETLSGGERVRLALARAFAGRPAWVLLDEPLAHLDPNLSAWVRETVPTLLDELGAAAITVTHDPDDVPLFGTRLLALTGDGDAWLGDAAEALRAPAHPWLARFSGRGTVLEGRADEHGRFAPLPGAVVSGFAPGAAAAAFLPAGAVRVVDGDDASLVAPDGRGGAWLRLSGQLLRSADDPGGRRAGERVGVVLEDAWRPLGTG